MVVCLADKKQADAFLEKGVIEMGGETAYTEPWQETSSEEKRCFNCQQYGHKAAVCVRIPVCGNCAAPGHSHRNCINSEVGCPNCGGNHPANSYRCSSNPSTRFSAPVKPFPNATQDDIPHA